jgi:hypothetical protein
MLLDAWFELPWEELKLMNKEIEVFPVEQNTLHDNFPELIISLSSILRANKGFDRIKELNVEENTRYQSLQDACLPYKC